MAQLEGRVRVRPDEIDGDSQRGPRQVAGTAGVVPGMAPGEKHASELVTWSRAVKTVSDAATCAEESLRIGERLAEECRQELVAVQARRGRHETPVRDCGLDRCR